MNEELDPFDPDETFAVRVEEVANNKTLMPITRRLAKKIMTDEYITVGDFVIQMYDEELEDLVEIIPSLEASEEIDGAKEIFLLSELLALGEGLPPGNAEEIMHRANFFSKLLVFESLYRKGFINAYHENWTLDLDPTNEEILVEAIPGMIDEFKRLLGNDPNGE